MAGTTAVEIIDSEVRELIRRRGLDPWREPGSVTSLVDEVVADYAERAFGSALPPVGDAGLAARAVRDQVAGFGPLQAYLDDPEIEEIWVNEPGKVFVARQGRSELTTTVLDAALIADLIERMLRTSGRRLDHSTPFVDARRTSPGGSSQRCGRCFWWYAQERAVCPERRRACSSTLTSWCRRSIAA